MASSWFAIKTFYRASAEGRAEKPDLQFDPDATLVEDRTLIFKAKTRKEAIHKAEKEAMEYAKRVKFTNPYNQIVTMKYLKMYDVFEIEAGHLQDRSEVFTSARLMSKRVTDRKIAHAFISPRETNFTKGKRRKFVNREYLQD